MENGIEKAIEQMSQKDEAGLNYIYSKTYNFVYLRSKNILDNEEDVKRLMANVYLEAYASAEGLKKENLYEWLGKRTYMLGCRNYKKRKEREVPFLEMEKSELLTGKSEDMQKSIEIICEVLDELPDLYQATVYAFYYDYLSVDAIAELMECSSDVIRNRLNYVRRYIKEAMENYMQEQANPVPVTFSVEILCQALRTWSVDHCLGMTTAQRLYAAICKEAGLVNRPVYLEGKEFAGVNNTVIYHRQDDLETLKEEILRHVGRSTQRKNVLIAYAGIGVLVLVVLVAAVIMLKKPADKKPPQKKPMIEQQDGKKDDKKDEDVPKDETGDIPGDIPGDVPADEPAQVAASEYIFENSDTVALTKEEIQTHTKEELRLARNEIYARHGVIFGVEDLDNYFNGKSWYTPRISLSDFRDQEEMSLTEEENITRIQEVENAM